MQQESAHRLRSIIEWRGVGRREPVAQLVSIVETKRVHHSTARRSTPVSTQEGKGSTADTLFLGKCPLLDPHTMPISTIGCLVIRTEYKQNHS